MSREPQWPEVLGWMGRNGYSPMAAARHFYPSADKEQLDTISDKFRKWIKRHGQGAVATRTAAPPPPPPPPQAPPVPAPQPQGAQAEAQRQPEPEGRGGRVAPRFDVARMSPLERLELQVAQLAADAEQARQVGDLRTAAAIDDKLSERANELEAERSKAAKVLRLDRTVGAVAGALTRKQRALELYAEKERRRAERAALAAARTTEDAGSGPAEGG